ncbi:MAG: hypothetical protein QM749_02235 [Aquabacterium sp.]
MDEPLFAQLQALGAGEFQHLNGSLATHLHGTEALLRQWGARPALCRAGLYHAVYGTDGYQPALLDVAHRQHIQSLLGEEAEGLAYLYGAADRGRFYPRIGTPAQCLFSDRFTHTDHEISPGQLADLCELVMANELEIAAASDAFRAQYGAALSGLFERMQGLVSDAAFGSYRAILQPMER